MKLTLSYCYAILFSLASLLVGCSSDSGSDNPITPIDDDPTINSVAPLLDEDFANPGVEGTDTGPVDPGIEGTDTGPLDPGIEGTDTGPIDSRAQLGPVIAATVKIFDIADLSKVLCETKTSDDNNYLNAGRFTIPANCIKTDKFYMIEVSGGADIDIDDDGIINSLDENDYTNLDPNDHDGDGISNDNDSDYLGDIKGPLPVKGVFNAILSGEQMLSKGWKVSTLTEYLFEALVFDLTTDLTRDELLNRINLVAPLLVRDDLNQDGIIDALDIALWDPEKHRDLYIPITELRQFIQSIHLGKNAVRLFGLNYPSLIAQIDTLTATKEVIVQDGFAYVTTANTLLIMKIRGKKSEIVGWFPTGEIATVIIDGDKAYVSLFNIGIQIIDISNRALPTLEDIIVVDDMVWSSLRKNADHLLYLAGEKVEADENSYTEQLVNVDLRSISLLDMADQSSTPSTISQKVISIADEEDFMGVNYYPQLELEGNTAYVYSNSKPANHIKVIDVTTIDGISINNPQVLDKIWPYEFDSLRDYFEVSNSRLYRVNHQRVEIDVYDVSNPADATILAGGSEYPSLEVGCASYQRINLSVNRELIVSACSDRSSFGARLNSWNPKTLDPIATKEIAAIRTQDFYDNHQNPTLAIQLQKLIVRFQFWLWGETRINDIAIDSTTGLIAADHRGLQLIDVADIASKKEVNR